MNKAYFKQIKEKEKKKYEKHAKQRMIDSQKISEQIDANAISKAVIDTLKAGFMRES